MHYGTFLARSFGEEAEASAVGALSSPSTMPTKAIKPVVASLVVVVLIISTAISTSATGDNVDDFSELNVKKDDLKMKDEGTTQPAFIDILNTEELPEPQACIGGMGSLGMYKLFLLSAVFVGGVIALLVILFLKCYNRVAEESRQRRVSKQEKADKLPKK